MAITQNELNIANTSYTNKDFEAIYTELLTLAKKISYRFDPTSSSESDPFVMLLKLLAFVGDKVNYNIDKNILERFLLSATQEKSVRELTDMLGYHMHYYEAATTNVIFKASTTSLTDRTFNQYTILTNDTNDVAYVTLNNVTIPAGSYESPEVEVMQGTLHDFTVLGSNIITLDNLDADYRLYFSELMIAQNGVFIQGGSALSSQLNIWQRVDNLNTQEYGSKAFMFGFDSKQNLPYIQFPEWIYAIIGEGLTIKYLTTSGVDGNIQAKSLKNITTADSSIDLTTIKVVNASAALNGKDPETIDEAYQGFKKTVGTFNTLVSCRDYANYIYQQLLDSNNNPVVSNIQVSDRRNDINYTANVVGFTDLGEQMLNYPTTPVGQTAIKAFDLCLYPLQKVADTEFTYKSKAENYNKSFKPSDSTDVQYIRQQLEDTVECLSHDYKNIQATDLYAVKNYYKINALISTFNKVTSSEQLSILEKINQKLTTSFNARSVDFGYEIAFDEIKQCMLNADSRISDVILYPLELSPVVMLGSGNEFPLTELSGTSGNKFYVIIAKNILSGKVEAFNYFSVFDLKYNMTQARNNSFPATAYTSIYNKTHYIKSLTSYANIGTITEATTYTLKENEVIQFISPNYYNKNSYPYGINYDLHLQSGDHIPANTEYTLVEGDSVTFEWRDSTTKQNIGRQYSDGQIIKPNFDMYTTQYRSEHGETPLSKTFIIEGQTTPTTASMFQIGTNEEVVDVVLNSETLNTSCKCYWYLNNDTNEIPWSNDEYLLEDGEYIWFADMALTKLSPGPFGSGTRLTRSSSTLMEESLEKITDISAVVEEGLDYLKSYFITVPLTSSSYLTITENEIVTLTAGYMVETQGGDLTVLNNTWGDVGQTIVSYGLTSSSMTTLAQGRDWKVRGLLDINAGPELDQNLYSETQDPTSTTQAQTHVIDIEVATYNAGTWTTVGHYYLAGNNQDATLTNAFKFNTLVQKMGGANISLQYIDLTCDKKDNINYPQLCYFRKPKQETTYQVYNNDSNYYVKELTATGTAGASLTLTVPVINEGSPATQPYKNLFMLYVPTANLISQISNVTELSGTGTDVTTSKLNSGVHILQITDNISSITIQNTGSTSISIVFSKLRVVDSNVNNGINPKLGLTWQGDLSGFIGNVLRQYATQTATDNTNLLTFNDNSRKISFSGDHTLASGEVYWDANNIANKWTIPEIDFTNSSITINPSCKK